jgi:hypothetical protein
MKNTKVILSIFLVSVFVLLNFGLKPYLQKKEAVTTAREILDLWVEGNLMASSVYWEEKQDYPPLYGITSYELTDIEYYKKDKTLFAKISARLRFTSNNIYADRKNWVFVLERKIRSWKVVDFYCESPSSETAN